MSVRLVPPNVIERFMSPPHVIDAAEAAKRDRQIADAIRLLAPKQVGECRAQLKSALDIMADAHRRDTRRRATKRAADRFDGALRRFQDECHRAGKAGVALPIDIDRVIERHKRWNALAPKRSQTPQQIAVKLAHDLMVYWRCNITVGPRSRWHQLAAIILGDRRANLYRQLRAFKIRQRPK
jgi:hypothetical protein